VSGLLLDLGKKLGERWVTLLILPGLLYVGTVVIAFILGWPHAADVSMLIGRTSAWSGSAAVRSAGGAVVLIAAVLLSSSGAALAAEAFGTVIARAWLAEHWSYWPTPARALARWLVDARASRWDKAIAAYRAERDKIGHNQAHAARGAVAEQPYDLGRLYYPVERVGRERPVRPTWVGDRLHALTVSLHRQYDLDLPAVWPALSLIMPSEAGAAIDAATHAYRRAAALAGWAVLYAAVGIAWWPGLAIASVTAATASYRSRVAVEDYCLLVEAAVALYTPNLLRTVGIAHDGALDRKAGAAITCYLQGDGYSDA
jgi:hypothetical protein